MQQVSAITQTLMKTPSASTIKDVPGVAGLTGASQTNLVGPDGTLDMVQAHSAMTIEYNKVSNTPHELYLREDQKEMKSVMSKREQELRQN